MKLTPELANKIISDYGAVLAENSQDVISERLLPYEKKTIADASELPRAHARGILKAKLRLPCVFRTLTDVR